MSVNSKMTALADVIRDKTKTTGKMGLDEMAQTVLAISTGNGKGIKSVSCITYTDSGYLLGDANNDGAIDSSDNVLISRYMLDNDDAGVTVDAIDINGDGKSDTLDLVAFASVFDKFDGSKSQIIGRIEITYNDDSIDKYYVPIEIPKRS